MRQDYWEFEPTHTVFMAVNHKPIVWGTDNAIWRRIKLIPFTETIAPSDTSFVWTRESAGEILEFRRPDTGGRVQDLAIERLTVAQAAARLGVSQDAVRKRIKRGTIEYEQDQDGRLHVYLDPLEVYETRQDRAADEPTERLAWAQHQEIEFLRRELETRTEEIRHRWQERRRVRGGRLDRRPYGREAHAARARWRERLPRRTAPPPDVPLPFRRASPSHTKAVSKTMLTRGNGNNASTAPPSNNHEAPRG
jgi:excisionase family DNA binding protein